MAFESECAKARLTVQHQFWLPPTAARPLRARRRLRCRSSRLVGLHRSSGAHHAGPHASAGHHRARTVTAAVGAMRGPAKPEPREKDHRDDKHDTRGDAHHGQELIDPTRPISSIRLGLACRCGWFGGFRCLSHASHAALHIPRWGRD